MNNFSVVKFNEIPGLQKYVGRVPTVENTLEILEIAETQKPEGHEFFTIIQIGVNHFVVYKKQKIILKRRWW